MALKPRTSETATEGQAGMKEEMQKIGMQNAVPRTPLKKRRTSMAFPRSKVSEKKVRALLIHRFALVRLCIEKPTPI